MKKRKAVLMPVKPEGLLGDIKTANVFHHPVEAKNLNFNSYIYIFFIKQIFLISCIFSYAIANFWDI